MKRTPLLLSFLFVLLIGLGLFFYFNYYAKEELKVWDLVPLQTVLVYEVGECEACIEQVRSTVLFSTFAESFFNNHAKGKIGKLVSIISESKSQSLLSLHVIKKDDFDFIYYLPRGKSRQVELYLDELINETKKYSDREYNGVQIKELSIDGKIFSWATIDGIWIGSFTPFLVEDVIRTYRSGKGQNFVNYFGSAVQFSTIKNDAGNIYLNLQLLNGWLSVFLENPIEFTPLGKTSVMDIKQREGNLSFNGFSVAQGASDRTILSNMSGQTPVSFALKGFVSNRSVAVTSFGISNGTTLFRNLDLHSKKSTQDSIRLFSDIDFETLYASLGNEIVTCYLESSGRSTSRVLLFNSSNSKEWINAFDALSRAAEKEDSIFVERYSVYEIRQIEINNLPEKLFKPLVHGFSQTYYTSIGNTFILAERVEELRKFLDDIDKEEVWGKSVYYNQFLETTLLESNYSIFINTPRALSVVSNRLSDSWKRVYATSRNQFNAIGLCAIQFSNLNENFYTNISWSFSSQTENRGVAQSVARDRIQVNLDNSIASRPFTVRNHVTKQNEYVFQDSLFVMHYFSSDGKRQWKKEVQSNLVGEISQIDYLNNSKLQLFFATHGKFHVVDRLGNYVSPFPVSLPQQNIEFVSVIDYDNSKKYRFLLADKAGKLWMFDQEGKNLDGWKPRNVEGSLAIAPRHYRVRGKDYIMALRQDGWVYLMNRRGENIKGYPVNLDLRPGGGYFLEPGASSTVSTFVIISKDGIKVKLNIDGQVLSREPLIRTTVDDQFSLVNEKNYRSYLIARQNSKELAILDENGKVILGSEFIGKNKADIQYYAFGSGLDYIVLTDIVQELSYVYDGSGKLLTPVPIEASGVAINYDGQKAFLAYVHEKSFTILPL
ncbi:MAG: hypothetical protein KF687_18435 [Cyclobacteriaceae bacterium]|nr:hypothetical protein [Cyclobacteriaceae bacterium]